MSIIIATGRPEDWGLIPSFLDADDPRSAIEQFDAAYIGGWQKFDGFAFNPNNLTLKYPGDPALKAIGIIQFRDETILLFPYAWVLVMQKDGTWEACRMD